MQQTVNGVPQTYLLDTASGLTQVLADGAHTYLYGVDRIAQQGITVTEYFLGDALGSVRQLVDTGGNVTLAKSYQPYGEVLDETGSQTTSYGYTGELTDTTGLVYLRSRYYAPWQGRFNSRDLWNGDGHIPLSLNRWNYVQGNPIIFSDPTGYIKQGQEAKDAEGILSRIKTKGINIIKDWGEITIYATEPLMTYCGWNEGVWKIRELELIEEATNDIDRVLKGKIKVAIKSARVEKNLALGATAPPGISSTILGDITVDEFSSDELGYRWGFAHEIGHVWDYRSGNQLSFGLMKELGTWICTNSSDPKAFGCHWDPYHPTIDLSTGKTSYPEPPPDTKLGCETSPPGLPSTKPGCEAVPYSSTYGRAPFFTGPGAEDWANSFAYFVYQSYRIKEVIGINQCPIRRKYVQNQIRMLR